MTKHTLTPDMLSAISSALHEFDKIDENTSWDRMFSVLKAEQSKLLLQLMKVENK